MVAMHAEGLGVRDKAGEADLPTWFSFATASGHIMRSGDPISPVTGWQTLCGQKFNYVCLQLSVLPQGHEEAFRESRIYGLSRAQARQLAARIQTLVWRLESGGQPDARSE